MYEVSSRRLDIRRPRVWESLSIFAGIFLSQNVFLIPHKTKFFYFSAYQIMLNMLLSTDRSVQGAAVTGLRTRVLLFDVRLPTW